MRRPLRLIPFSTLLPSLDEGMELRVQPAFNEAVLMLCQAKSHLNKRET